MPGEGPNRASDGWTGCPAGRVLGCSIARLLDCSACSACSPVTITDHCQWVDNLRPLSQPKFSKLVLACWIGARNVEHTPPRACTNHGNTECGTHGARNSPTSFPPLARLVFSLSPFSCVARNSFRRGCCSVVSRTWTGQNSIACENLIPITEEMWSDSYACLDVYERD